MSFSYLKSSNIQEQNYGDEPTLFNPSLRDFNGRVNINSNLNTKQSTNEINSANNGTPFFIQDKVFSQQNTNFDNFRHTQLFENNILEKAFFSPKNFIIIQNGIKSGVFVMSDKKYIIAPQDHDSLYIIMRSIYLSYSLNTNTNYKEQIEALNQLVIDYCVPKVYNEIQSYMKYKRDASQLAQPMQNPISTNYRNDSVEFKTFF